MKVFQARSKEGAIRKAIRELNAKLKNARGIPTLFMVSGGSALELLDGISMRNIGTHITLTVLDERHSKDPAVNNFWQLTQTHFYKKAEKKGIDYIDTRILHRMRLKGLVKKFEKGLKKWKKKYRKGVVIVTQGIGEDGHTAGILPYPKNPVLFKRLFDDPSKWVVGYNAGKRNEYPLRVTVTLAFLREIVDHSIVYAAGRKKKGALARALARDGTLYKTPARIINELKEAALFTDTKILAS